MRGCKSCAPNFFQATLQAPDFDALRKWTPKSYCQSSECNLSDGVVYLLGSKRKTTIFPGQTIIFRWFVSIIFLLSNRDRVDAAFAGLLPRTPKRHTFGGTSTSPSFRRPGRRRWRFRGWVFEVLSSRVEKWEVKVQDVLGAVLEDVSYGTFAKKKIN